ncbi:unnamed protein product, partial [Prunus brigantina]
SSTCNRNGSVIPILLHEVDNKSQMGQLSSKTNRVKEETKNIVEKKKACSINICKSLERLQSDIRSLRDRSVEEQEHRW